MAHSAFALLCIAALAACSFAAPEGTATGTATSPDASKDSIEVTIPDLDVLVNKGLNILDCVGQNAQGAGVAIEDVVKNSRDILNSVSKLKAQWKSCKGLVCKLEAIKTATDDLAVAEKDVLNTAETVAKLVTDLKTCVSKA